MSYVSIRTVDNATGATVEAFIGVKYEAEPAGSRLWRGQWRRARRASYLAFFLGMLVIAGTGAPAGAGEYPRKETSLGLSDPQQRKPIVNGHHVQPLPGDFNDPEFTPNQSRQVDDLYLQIMRMRDSEAREANRVLRSGRD